MDIFTGHSVETITSALIRYRDSRGLKGFYLLIDRINGLPGAFEDMLADLGESARRPVVDASIKKYPTRALELIRLTDAEHALLTESVEHALAVCQGPTYGLGHSFVAGWLFSDDPARNLERGLLELFDQKHSNGTSVYFRAFDPRIRMALKRVLGGPLPSSCFAEALAWAYLQWDGALILDRSGPTGPLRLDANAWRHLDGLAWLHPALAEWAAREQVHPTEAHVIQAEGLLRRARQTHRLEATDDIIAFAAYGLSAPDNFDQSGDFQKIVADARQHSVSLRPQLELMGASAQRPA